MAEFFAHPTAIVDPGARIGAGTRVWHWVHVCAGAVVTSKVAAYALMVGMPARRVGWICQCGGQLPSRSGAVSCAKCGKRYRIGKHACQSIQGIKK